MQTSLITHSFISVLLDVEMEYLSPLSYTLFIKPLFHIFLKIEM